MRSRKLLNAARDWPCIRCGTQDGTVVAAHYSGRYANLLGKGTGIKPWDHCVAFYCAHCHAEADSYAGGNSDERAVRFLIDILRTQKSLFDEGVLRVG